MVNVDQVVLGKTRTAAVISCGVAVDVTLGSQVSIPHQDNHGRTATLGRPLYINVRA
jgi:hypothetical protein